MVSQRKCRGQWSALCLDYLEPPTGKKTGLTKPAHRLGSLCEARSNSHLHNNRVATLWNELPVAVKSSPTVITFESRYDKQKI